MASDPMGKGAASILERLHCVDCGGKLEALRCVACDRQYEAPSGIPALFQLEDMESDTFHRYEVNYERIATDDLEKDIVPRQFRCAQAEKLARYCGGHLKGRVLDVGSGQGDFLSQVPHDDKVALDIARAYLLRLAERGWTCIQANAERLPFEEEFDLIVSTDVLEHVLDERRAMESLARALNVRGRVVIRVPLNEDLSKYDPAAGCPYEFVHLRTFNEETLTTVVEEAGLRVVRLAYDGFSVGQTRKAPRSRRPIDWMVWGIGRVVSRVLLRVLRNQTRTDALIAQLPERLGVRIFVPITLTIVAEKPPSV